MKIILILLFCTMFLLQGCNQQTKGEAVELTPEEVIARLRDTEQNSFMLYVTSENCYSCEEYEKVIQEVQDETPFDIYYVVLDLNEEDKDTISAFEELQIITGDIQALPTTYYFYQGGLTSDNKKEGYLEKRDLVSWLNSLHLLH